MQLSLDLESHTQELRDIHKRLAEYYSGFPPRYRLFDPLSQLVMSKLGGLTYGHLSRAAHSALEERFTSWGKVRGAPSWLIFEIIQDVKHPEKKAPRIQACLKLISKGCDEPDLSCLEEMSVAEAHYRLEKLPGVGPKTAAAVLNTSTLRKRSLVIDTHHLRILRRLGMAPPTASIQQAYPIMMSILPKEWSAERIDEHHMLVKRLGQHLCRPNVSKCHVCPLRAVCEVGRRMTTSNQRLAGPYGQSGKIRAR